ncbi:MAG: galactose-1-phosphate uridylyltransferase [Planctomycetia bacterium 21-64-5]|nr:MAG: galactose-1-phosphate uridylyltransferase [Planctomycetia bacterium 21-64-5]
MLAYRPAGSPANGEGWRVRAVPNKFPALEIEGDLHKRGDGIYDMMRGVGAHEVIIESPRHLLSTSDLTEEELCEVLWVYRDRLVDLKKDPRLVYGMIFKNVGAAAGASLEHTHSQLIVTPIVPIVVMEEMKGSQEFYRYRGRCVFCDMVQQELAGEKRIVLDTPGFVAFCPFASRFPFETWILPKGHASHYENIQKHGVEELARVLRQVIGNIELALDRPSYNYILHTAPFDSPELGHYHWHIEIIPRLTRTAGFEWGSGFYINPVPPEEAAAFLRDVEVESHELRSLPVK